MIIAIYSGHCTYNIDWWFETVVFLWSPAVAGKRIASAERHNVSQVHPSSVSRTDAHAGTDLAMISVGAQGVL